MKNKTGHFKRKSAVFVLTAVLLLTVISIILLSSCDIKEGPPPALADVKEQLTEKIESAKAVNMLLFGPGPEVYDPESEEAQLLGLYTDETITYLVAKPDADCMYVSQIREMAEAVYSPNYISGILSLKLDGYVYDSNEEETVVLTADYMDSTDGLLVSVTHTCLVSEARCFLYDTMVINETKSSDVYLDISVDSYLPSAPEEITHDHVTFRLCDGEWLLDMPTY